MKTGGRSLLLALVSRQLLLGLFLALIGPFTAEAASMRFCKAMCGETIAASCSGLRKGKLRRCRTRLLKECKHNRLDCAPPATTTTLAPTTTTTTMAPVTTTLPPVTTSTLGPTTTTTTIPDPCATKPNGTACNDGSACTQTDTCQGGVCTGSNPVVCTASDQCHVAGTCDPATGACSSPAAADGTTCSDGNACTTGDTCRGGSCVGSPVICVANPLPTQCTTTAEDCNPNTGQCVIRNVLDGTACNDNNACTTGDSCQSGVCTGHGCAGGHTCCSTNAPCVDLQFDSNNCGACGTVCTNSACLFGHCYAGCVINGAGYPNGTHNPNAPCQICDTSQTRTAWTNLGENFPNPPTVTCTEGCFNGFCDRGDCSVLGQLGAGAGCTPSSSCSAASCNQNGVCVQTPINGGAACTPPLTTSACLSPTVGTCQNGQCVAASINDFGYCNPPPPADARCRSTVDGICAGGECIAGSIPDGTSCAPIPADQCKTGTCSGGVCQVSNVPDSTGCLPDSTNLCKLGHCFSGICGQSFVSGGAPETKTCPDACGTGTTCDPATGTCGGVEPSFGETHCSASGTIAPDPSKCCPGQVCLCPPTPAGIPQFCLLFGCWNPADVPTDF